MKLPDKSDNMTNCDCLIHPFQNDPGTSQHERIMEELLAGAAKIDARTMADLLDYFVQLSRHINYYDLTLNVKDWQPFFSNSIPFTLASIIKYPFQPVENNFELYSTFFERRPSYAGLQLSMRYIYFRFIRRINTWHLILKESKLPFENTIEALIRNNLQDPVKKFIQFANAAVKTYDIGRIDFSELLYNEAWNLDQTDLYAIDTSFSSGTLSKFKRISNLYGNFSALFPVFLAAVKTLANEAGKSLEASLVPLTDDLQKNHPPHLALLFAFLNMFRQLQDDLNQFTRRHLDYFYRDILHFIPRPANPDKAFVIFEIQKQLEKYLLKKGLKIKGGKDDKKQEILFALDDEIVVNKAQVAETRSLFVDNRIIHDTAYVAGVYMAPDATMADGIDKPFRDDQPENFPTLGARESKYILPGSGVSKPYPSARMGFILASNVLLLKEGTRTITFRLKCQLADAICNEQAAPLFPARDKCCDGNSPPEPPKISVYPEFLPPDKLYADMIAALNKYYYYINEDLLQELIKKGIGNDLINFLREVFLTRINKICFCETETIKSDNIIDAAAFESLVGETNLKLISDVIKKRKALKLMFSGEKEWIEPSELKEISFSILGPANEFDLTIEAVLNPDKPAVTFFNKENLKEDFDTTLPLVRIELDDHFKIPFNLDPQQQGDPCCLDRKFTENSVPVSLYHFFRNVKLIGKRGQNHLNHSDETQISVNVCGLKNFIIQNDESVLDVNGLIQPFGSRPKIDSNFFIGSEEIFSKNWSNLYINLNWKDFPPIPTTGIFAGPGAEKRRFQAYYNGYQDVFRNVAPSFTQGEIMDDKFKTQFSYLFDGKWYDKNAPVCVPANINDLLFKPKPGVNPDPPNCNLDDFTHQFQILPGDFISATKKHVEILTIKNLTKLDVNTRNFFIKLTLKCQDFQHDKYPIVLARQMAAFAKLPDLIDGAVYYGVITGNKIDQFSYEELTTIILQASGIAGGVVEPAVTGIVNEIINEWGLASFYSAIWNIVFGGAVPSIPPPAPLPLPKNKLDSNLYKKVEELVKLLGDEAFKINNMKDKGVIIPREPWTPTLSKISLDYIAKAYYDDISLIHLYPFAGTFKHEEIAQRPPLFPTFCDEGTLFLGLKDLVPGNNLNLMFQLAEATSDSESEKEQVNWHYLENNIWKPLRPGFEVIEDGTRNLTTTGILELAIPENISRR